MLYRWTDTKRVAVEFEATPSQFAGRVQDALIDARLAARRWYHDGSTHRNMQEYRPLELHAQLPNAWVRIGAVPYLLHAEDEAPTPLPMARLIPEWQTETDHQAKNARKIERFLGAFGGTIREEMGT